MIDGYLEDYDLNIDRKEVHVNALEWSRTRGARSGRVAFQYMQDLAGKLKIKL